MFLCFFVIFLNFDFLFSNRKETLLLDLICCGIDLSTQEASAVTLMLSLMSILLSNGLFSVHDNDNEFYEVEG